MTSSVDVDTSNRPCVLGGLGRAQFVIERVGRSSLSSG